MNLSEARLIEANLREANLSGVDLSGVDLSGVDLSGVDLNEVNLSALYRSGANIGEDELIGVCFSGANLSGADLSGADLSEADLSGAHLSGAFLIWTHLSGADLSEADLIWARLRGANLHGANLRGANLRGAHLREAYLIRADLHKANLREADLSGAHFSGANLSGATVGWTIFGDVDLSGAKGLETVQHEGPSTIGIDTLFRSKGQIPEVFLRGVGVPEVLITYLPSMLSQPIQYYSCFISYLAKDTPFATRLYADLQQKGVRCWFAPEDLKIGAKIRPAIDETIRLHDKLLLVLSEHSVRSQWVEQEVETALARERKQDETVLFPIRLDNTVMELEGGWSRPSPACSTASPTATPQQTL
ncbi:MAG: toll/interleukin-1 receptor domain-containing protein [Chloroflexi bacterium]|nr:toll/interleukin-1 receptor domain-containing protein [Chloroflexota bacterium]